jgi:hypothetical protein
MFRGKIFFVLYRTEVLTTFSQPPSGCEKTHKFSTYEKRPHGDLLGEQSKVFVMQLYERSFD